MLGQPRIADTSDQWAKNLSWTLSFLKFWLLSGIVLLLICALKSWVDDPQRDGFSDGLSILCNGSLLSFAFAGVGGIVGFLFGIPRRDAQPKVQSPDVNNKDSASTTGPANYGEINTNLEQVSDWLTKIILGAGLTQLVKVPALLRGVGEYFKTGFDGSPTLPLVIVMNSLVFGFFAGYLLTQLFLAKALTIAAQASHEVDAALKAAGTLEQAKQFGAATATLEGALTTFRSDIPQDKKRSLFEQLTYNALYEDAPGGFQKAIRYADQYIGEEPNNPSAKIWANLAAALGQKYKWDSAHNAAQDALDATTKRALEACRAAISLEPQMKGLLKMLWNPNDPTKVGPEEDDLEVFYSDQDFKNLLGS